jgi:acetyl esterase/lipase
MLYRLTDCIVKRILDPRRPVHLMRRLTDLGMSACPSSRSVASSTDDLGGIPALKLTPAPPHDETPLLYFHGGGYVIGSTSGYRRSLGPVVRILRKTLIAVDYRRAPEHPYPAALEDALTSYNALAARFPTGNIVVAGDSAGGGLALALCLRLKQAGLPQPRALVLFSPWVDLAQTKFEENVHDPMLNPSWLQWAASRYCNGANATLGTISPLFADDLSGIPPTLIQTGSEEILWPQSKRLHARLKEAGVEVTLERWEGLWHIFQMDAGLLPASRLAIEHARQFIKAQAGAIE